MATKMKKLIAKPIQEKSQKKQKVNAKQAKVFFYEIGNGHSELVPNPGRKAAIAQILGKFVE